MPVEMLCTTPPPLTDEQIQLALDGLEDAKIHVHLQNCEHCANQLHTIAGFQARIQESLYRFDCPDPEELSHYHLNLFLDDARQSQIALHLKRCVLCRDELASLVAFLEHESSLDEKILHADFGRSTADSKVILFPSILPAAKSVLRGKRNNAIIAKAESSTVRLKLSEEEEDYTLNIQVTSGDVDWRDALVMIFQAGELKLINSLNQFATCDCKLSEISAISLQIIAHDKTMIEFRDVDIEI